LDSPFYSPNKNAIVISAGFFLPPRYHINYPLAVKYGGLGVIIGHELMHAFDASGIKAGLHPDKEWLKPSVFREFEKRKNCLIRQYSKQCSPSANACISGTRTVSENIGDVDGTKIVYTAFKFATQVFGEDPPIPSMLHYTNDQLFFLASARTWCSTSRTTDDLLSLPSAEHTPDEFRVDVTLRNVPVFARAFQCIVGSKYAPLKICTVWGDLANPARKR